MRNARESYLSSANSRGGCFCASGPNAVAANVCGATIVTLRELSSPTAIEDVAEKRSDRRCGPSDFQPLRLLGSGSEIFS